MILASIVAVIVALLFTLLIARALYKFSIKSNKLASSKDYVINGIIIAFIFFCISSFIYVTLLNIIY
ncbi:hypothetical protein fh0823_26390 [Francisella halioticida]|uniref:Uncharacterized protein n=1 Tax=Francisella halioticida TaxID=549298 RepID=A0ABM6LXL9_9GAMM|nr:hypothetical protein CDV26_02050 [Francisella halioticida]BCD92500.1 hypothetical protein fh0823_26390 [Francisella halioticida]